MINCRKETVKLLNRTFTKDAYSNILLDNVFSENEMSSSDKKFIMYEDAKHRIVHNEGSEERINDIIEWLNANV